jgi:hypothetical protein
MPDIESTIAIILVLSIASERMVEIVKNFIPWLSIETTDMKQEGRRRGCLHAMAVVAGIVTAFLGMDYFPKELMTTGTEGMRSVHVLGLGLLASGGSGFWNAILTYFVKLKDVKGAEAVEAKRDAGITAQAGRRSIAPIDAADFQKTLNTLLTHRTGRAGEFWVLSNASIDGKQFVANARIDGNGQQPGILALDLPQFIAAHSAGRFDADDVDIRH